MLVRNLSAEFTSRGHRCHILFMSDAGGVGNPQGFEREFLDWLEARRIGFDVIGQGGFSSVLRSAAQLREAVTAVQADVLHIHLARGLLCRAVGGLRTATVYTHHNVTANFPTILFKVFDRSVDRYVSIGAACEAFLRRHVRRPIVRIPNGVPESFARGRARTGMAQDPFVLAVGNLSPQKDYATFIEAAALAAPRFAAAGRDIRFAIAGEGADRDHLQQLIEQRGLGQRFKLLGARSDVSALMERADILVNSSVHEGLPITLIEAAMSALPVVATDVGGNSEVIIEGGNGRLVECQAPSALAQGIVDLLSSNEAYASMSRASLAHSARFTISACADAHLAMYEELVDQRAPRANRS